jgi:predicted phosphodiesterase
VYEKPNKKQAAAIAVVVAAALLFLSIGYVLLSAPSEVDVDGGTVVASSSDVLVIRCLSPSIGLDLNGYEGDVLLVNCHPDAVIEGYNGGIVTDGARKTFTATGDEGHLEVSVPEKTEFSFAVMGDSQGHNEILSAAVGQLSGCEFAIHCGDLVPSGRSSEYAALEEVFNESSVPVYTTPGNHDVREGGAAEYEARLAPMQYAFTYSGITFAFVDSSDLNVSDEEISWLRETFEGADHKVIVTHGTSYDPFEFNHTLDPGSCDRLQEFALEEGVTAVQSGHVHAYYKLRVEGTDFLITGGAGGTLTDGVHHFVIVNVTSDREFSYEMVELSSDITLPTQLVLIGRDGTVLNMSYSELSLMDLVAGYSSYENLYGNIAGGGYYEGVPVSALVDLIGGMQETDTLKVSSTDGYFQTFGYLNVFPDATWLERQGPMLLALSMDNVSVPDWTEGPRIAMLAPDGVYSNSDCELTSYEGQGYDVYASAGARWVKNVWTIEVIPGA